MKRRIHEFCALYRAWAPHLGILHRSVFRLVSDYRPDFEAFGKVRFENAPSSSGQSEKFALLNEDQAYLLLTYSHKTPLPVIRRDQQISKRGST